MAPCVGRGAGEPAWIAERVLITQRLPGTKPFQLDKVRRSFYTATQWMNRVPRELRPVLSSLRPERKERAVFTSDFGRVTGKKKKKKHKKKGKKKKAGK